MYTKLIKLSKKLYSLNLKKEAQEILILEGVAPEEFMSMFDILPVEEITCEHQEEPEEKEDSSDLTELMEKLFGKEDKEKKEKNKDLSFY